MTYTAFELDGSLHTVAGHIELDDALVADQQPRVADDQAFRAAMRLLAAGVVMVTARHEGRPWGLTISACCSLTLEPPQILISLRASTVSCKVILDDGHFGVSILSASQKNLAELGAAVGVVKFIDDYCEGDDQLESPMIAGALYHLDCQVAGAYEIGDHTLIVGRVQQAVYSPLQTSREADPLVYFNRSFWRLGEIL
jgi:flavin reductase (DIM6/NTAB) family NADH-FMN oxidoreductase RutF